MKIELAEVVEAWDEKGIRESVFKFPVSLTDKKRVHLITFLSDKRIIPVLEGLTI